MSTPLTVHWAAGPHHGLVWDRGAALLLGQIDHAVVACLWRRLFGVDRLWAFVETLGEVASGGLLALPPFAVMLPDGLDVTIAVRGPFTVFVDDTGPGSGSSSSGSVAPRVYEGMEVSTWCEAHCRGPARIDLTMLGENSPAPSPVRPLSGGVVPARSLAWAPDAAGEPSLVHDHVADHLGDDRGDRGPVDGDTDSSESARPPGSPDVEPATERASLPASVSSYRPVSAAVHQLPSARQPKQEAESAPTRPAENPPHPGPEPQSDDAPEPSRFAQMWEETYVGSVEAAAVRPLPPATVVVPASAPSASALGDHDGQTILGRAAPRPGVRVRGSDGGVLEVEGTIVVGRNPSLLHAEGPLPARRLVLEHAHVSGTHLLVIAQDDRVLVRDLGSTNGTLLRHGDDPPQRLAADAVEARPDDVVDLGRGVTLTFERM